MEQAALAGGHGWEGVRLAGGLDALNCCSRGETKITVAVGLEAIGVEGDAIVVLGFEAKDLGCDVLDGVEEFAVAVGEERGVGAGEFDAEFRGWGGRSFGLADRISRGIVHMAVACGDIELQIQMPAGGERLKEVCNSLWLKLVCCGHVRTGGSCDQRLP